MKVPVITNVEVFQVRASARSTWLFVAVTLDTDQVGFGEATLDSSTDGVDAALRTLGQRLIGNVASELPITESVGNMVEAAAASAINQAICDGFARMRQVSVADLLGGQRRSAIELYANINRRTTLRTPEGFRDSAKLAQNAGFRAFKIAPFDEVLSGSTPSSDALSRGLARIEAVRTLIGSDARLMVDCHWRFDLAGALSLVDACADYHLHWIECPLPENRETLAEIARIRDYAHRRGILLAGGEDVVGLEGLQPYLNEGCYDVIMPDVKYTGGPIEMLRVADRLNEAEVEFSPHNPSGPVSHAASLEVCAAAQCVGLLECQFDETPLFSTLVKGGAGATARVTLDAKRIGLGVSLCPEALSQHSISIT